MENPKKYTIKIEKLDDDLHGVAFRGGKKFVVDGALAGEVVEAEEIKLSGNAVVCKLSKIVEPSADRIAAPCKYYDICGGCNLMHIPYETQLKVKTALVKRKLAAFGSVAVDDCVPSENFGARNKTHIAFAEVKGKIYAGFFNEETHRVVDIPACLCHGEWYAELRRQLIFWIKKYSVTLYNPRTGSGVLRFAAARYGENSLMLTLVVTENKPLKFDALLAALKKSFASVSIFVNVNNEKTNEVLSGKVVQIAGDAALNGECLGIKYSLTPAAFFQTNYGIAEKAYAKVLEEMKDGGSRRVVDLFSGIGITSALFAKNGFTVDAVEINPDSVNAALKLAVANGVEDKIKIRKGDCKDILPSISAPDAAFFVDPPRRGLTDEVARAVAGFSPARIVYLSCNLRTLVSDLQILTAAGYRITSATPFDMFPSTTHVETLTCLSKKS